MARQFETVDYEASLQQTVTIAEILPVIFRQWRRRRLKADDFPFEIMTDPDDVFLLSTK